MPRPKKIDEAEEATELDPRYEDMDTSFKCEKLEDFPVYNKWARKNNFPVRIPDESFYKKIKVRFQRIDNQPENTLKACVVNKDIEWEGQLIPGGTYELPIPVVKYLNGLAIPIFKEVDVKTGGHVIKETRQVSTQNRFSCVQTEFD